MSENILIYEPCAHIKRSLPNEVIDQDLMNKIATEYRTLPSFENTSYEHKLVKHYSLQTNELLKCRWSLYKKNIESRIFAPFQFPDVKDLHFYNGAIRFMPSLTISKQKNFKMKAKSGPGVDTKGQLYIPYEMLMKRGIVERETNKSEKRGDEKKNEEGKEDTNETKTGAKDVRKQRDVKKDVKQAKKHLKKDVKKEIKKYVKKEAKEVKIKNAKRDVNEDSEREDKK